MPNNHKNILLATRPLVPPWDEASKNFAYFLATTIRNPLLRLHLLTTKPLTSFQRKDNEGIRHTLNNLGDNCVEHPIYPQKDNNHAGFPFFQKMRTPLYLLWNSRRYDVIHYLFTPTKFNAFLLRYFRFGRRPKTIQTIATLREDRYTATDWKQMFFGDRLVTYSDYSKAKLEAAGFKGVVRIYPGVDLNRYRPMPKSEAMLEELGLKPSDFIVMYHGEYARLGATDMIERALIDYFTKNPKSDMRFVWACRIKNDADHAKKESLRNHFKSAGCLDHIRFTDTISDMPTLYNLADVSTFPVGNMHGKFDVPLVVIEAYACGKPVILSDLPLFNEFSHPDISVTIPAGSGSAFTDAILRLRNDPDTRKRLGFAARAFVEQHFDLRDSGAQYEEIYSSL